MFKLSKSILLLVGIILLDAFFYYAFIRPGIMHWGATETEASASLVGDQSAPYISGTRAITINAPRDVVWKWLVQLGGDRGGFYSYTIMAILLGYDNDNGINIVPEWQEMRVGRIVPSSKKSVTDPGKLRWTVVHVDHEKAFVLQGWGAFVLEDVGPDKTRLIVRTHGSDTPTFMSRVGYFFMIPMHHIMERRMLMGLKARAEAGPGAHLSAIPDYIWLAGLFLSALGIIALIFQVRGVSQAMLACVYSILWLLTCLVFTPGPGYVVALLAIVLATIIWFAAINHRSNHRNRFSGLSLP